MRLKATLGLRYSADGLRDPDTLPLLSWKNVPSSPMPLLGQFRGGDWRAADFKAGHLEALEGQALGSQRGKGRLEVVDLECHLARCPTARPPSRRDETRLAPHVTTQTTGPVVDRVKPELVAVEGGSRSRSCAELGDGLVVGQRFGHRSSPGGGSSA